MIVDTSAVVAVIKAERGWEDIDQELADADAPKMSAGTFLELGIVVDRIGDPVVSRQLDQLIADWKIQIEPVTAEQAQIARAAYRDYGKRSGQRASLNFGDCFAYALASVTNETLLFVGGDFTHTDLVSA